MNILNKILTWIAELFEDKSAPNDTCKECGAELQFTVTSQDIDGNRQQYGYECNKC